MPIDTKPEQKRLSGPEAQAAIVDGVQRLIGKRVNPDTLLVTVVPGEDGGADIINISADIAGALKGPKPGAKQKPRAKSKDKDKKDSIGIGPAFQS